jgi:hypothetical protein
MKWISVSAALLFIIPGFAQTQPAVSSLHDLGLPAAALDANQLDNLIAPIALYPDRVLLLALNAAEYPAQLAEANRHVLHGDTTSVGDWDPSVSALLVLPNVISILTQNPQWTNELGRAYVNQPQDLYDASQRMRVRADALGVLVSSAEQLVSKSAAGDDTSIKIQSMDSAMIFIPVYNPLSVWGKPKNGRYPNLYYPGESYAGVSPEYHFWPGVDVGTSLTSD